ncbi:MAG: class I SAM-dependent methyltransferase [Cyanobacteria bacterium P01_H01_bin.74]
MGSQMSSTMVQNVFTNPVIQRLTKAEDEREANWCLPEDEAKLLYLLASIHQSSKIIELGTSIGYSTLHLALATQPFNGVVHTIDASDERQGTAKKNLADAGVLPNVRFILGDALDALNGLKEEAVKKASLFDFIFLDAKKSEYVQYLALANALIRPRGLLVADNTVSHQSEMTDFIQAIQQSENWIVSHMQTANGLIIAQKIN